MQTFEFRGFLANWQFINSRYLNPYHKSTPNDVAMLFGCLHETWYIPWGIDIWQGMLKVKIATWYCFNWTSQTYRMEVETIHMCHPRNSRVPCISTFINLLSKTDTWMLSLMLFKCLGPSWNMTLKPPHTGGGGTLTLNIIKSVDRVDKYTLSSL